MLIDFNHWKGSQIGDEIQSLLDLERNLSVIKNLNPVFSKDGNMWCYLYGELPNNCIVGFGATPYEAATDFATNFFNQKAALQPIK
jgi:hypothetical protein